MNTKKLKNCVFFAVFSSFVVGLSWIFLQLELCPKEMIDSPPKKELIKREINSLKDANQTITGTFDSQIYQIENLVNNIKIQIV